MTESVENAGRKNVGAEEDEFCCGGGVKPKNGTRHEAQQPFVFRLVAR